MTDFSALKGQMFCTHYLPQDCHPAGDLHTLLLMKGSSLDAVRFYMAELVRTSSSSFLPFSLPHRPPSASSWYSNIFTQNECFTVVLGSFGLARKLGAGQVTISSNEMFGMPGPPIPSRKCSLAGHMVVRLIYMDIWSNGIRTYHRKSMSLSPNIRIGH
jgi:hypothetical protein